MQKAADDICEKLAKLIFKEMKENNYLMCTLINIETT